MKKTKYLTVLLNEQSSHLFSGIISRENVILTSIQLYSLLKITIDVEWDLFDFDNW